MAIERRWPGCAVTGVPGSSAAPIRAQSRQRKQLNPHPHPMHASPILILLMQVTLILALSRVMGLIFRYLHQPQVMGEMVAGIMLGPSLFGLSLSVRRRDYFSRQSIALLNVLSQLGVIFFLFLVGLELDPKLLHNRGHAAVVISHVSIIAPFLLGAALALYLYPQLFNDAPRMQFTSVALFMGAAMSITAFPVLARILTERNLHKTQRRRDGDHLRGGGRRDGLVHACVCRWGRACRWIGARAQDRRAGGHLCAAMFTVVRPF